MRKYLARAIIILILVMLGQFEGFGQSLHAATRATAEVPPDRSTHFSATGQITYAHEARFDSTAAMTIEAWVYRHDETGCEAILDHTLSNSYFFGTCPRPRLYRSGAGPAEADTPILARRWTHVAVSYDGTTATFYINGEAAGSQTVGFGGLRDNDLHIGGTADGNYLNGALDEVRLWSVARTQQQIRDNLYMEIKDRDGYPGLQAVWADGGRHEVLDAITGTVGSGIEGSVAGILPRDLVVPRAVISPTLDGDVDVDFEYAGAEQLIIRYAHPAISDPPIDRTAHLIYTDDDLFIGMPSITQFAANWEDEASWLVLMLDPTFARGATVQPAQGRLKILLNSDDASTSVWQVGDDSGNFVDCTGAGCPQRGVDWDVSKAFHGDDVGPFDLAIEIRITKGILGEWTEVDGLAVGQFNAPAPAVEYPAPGNADGASPATWAIVSYGEGSAGLPLVHAAGRVFDGLDNSGTPAVGYKVTFGVIGTVTYEQTTDANGEFAFEVPMPLNQSLTLRIQECSFCRYGEPQSADTGTPPAAVNDSSVVFLACDAAQCTLADTDFFVLQPVGPTLLDSPTQAPLPGMRLNVVTGTHTPTDTVVIQGENLHDQLEIYLSPDTPEIGQNSWKLYPVTILLVSADRKSIEVETPILPGTTQRSLPNGPTVNTLKVDWRWVVKDNWIRPDWTDTFRSDTFRLIQPEYPEIYGFGFKNEDFDATYDEFLGVYGDSAYLCVGVLGVCATHVIDPLYGTLYYLGYKLLIDDSGGSCVGMSATSLLMTAGDISPAQFNPDVYFAAGFGRRDETAKWTYGGTLGKLTGPPQPANLWAHIRRNHGVQISAEIWGSAIAQIADHAVDGFIQRRLDILRANPDGYVLSMKNPDKTFGGHAVAPYAVVGSRVDVYDNNDRRNSDRHVDFNPSLDTFTFPRPSKNQLWNGSILFTFPIGIWRETRHFPLYLDASDLIGIYVFGDGDGGTDALVSTPAGSWGMTTDGSFIDTLPGAVTVPIPGQDQTGPVSGPLFVSASGPSPTVTINSHDDKYLFMSGDDQTVLQIQVSNSTPGDRDVIALQLEDTSPTGMTITPARDGTVFVPKLGMDLGPQARLLFRFWELQIPGGKSAEFQALPEAHGVIYTNDSEDLSTYTLFVDSVDGAAEEMGTFRFGPLIAPAGAVQRITVADWPVGDRLRIETDADGDGIFEDVQFASGLTCTSDDADPDGVPVQCATPQPDGQNVHLPQITR